MSEIDPSDILGVPQAAALMHVTRMTVKRMAADGRLTPIDPPNPALRRQRLRFRRADVMRNVPRPDKAPHLGAAPSRLLAEDGPGYDPAG
jgi:hypothetical protein